MSDVTKFTLWEVLREQDHSDKRFEKDRKFVKAHTTASEADPTAETPVVEGRPYFIWVREAGMTGGVFEAFNPNKAPLLLDWPVLLMYMPKGPFRWMVVDSDWDTILTWPSINDDDPPGYGIGNHHVNHEWPDFYPGIDVVNIYPRAHVPLRTYPSSGLTIDVAPLRYEVSREFVEFLGVSGYDLSGHQPASGSAVLVLVYLSKESNTILSVAGDTIADTPVILPPAPTIPVDSVPSALVRIDGDQTSVQEVDIIDFRPHIGGGSSSDFPATEIGQVAYSIDGVTLTAQKPLLDDTDGQWLADESGVLMIDG